MKPGPKEPTFDTPLYFDAKRMENAGLLRPGTALVLASASKTNAPAARKLMKSGKLAPIPPQRRPKKT